MLSRVVVTFATLLAGSYCASAQTSARPDFTGVWKLNPDKSRLEVPPPVTSVLRVRHEEPRFDLARTHVYQGKEDRWGIVLTTDGKEVLQKADDQEIHACLTWDGSSLKAEMTIILKDGRRGSNVVRYSLTEDRRTLTADERFDGPKLSYHNVWVFDRQ